MSKNDILKLHSPIYCKDELLHNSMLYRCTDGGGGGSGAIICGILQNVSAFIVGLQLRAW